MHTRTASPRTRTTRTRVATALAAVAVVALPTGISLTATASASSAAPTTKVVKIVKLEKARKVKHSKPAPKAKKAALPTVARSSAEASYESQVIYFINVERHKGGLGSVTSAGCPETTSVRWASHLASTDGFYHQSMYSLLDKCHAHYAGETLGRGNISPQTLVQMWMDSPPHHAVLMSRTPNRIGVGAVRNKFGEWVTAANFIKF